MPGDGDGEGCLNWCKKFRKAATIYGGSFLAVACSFVAYDVAERSKLMKEHSSLVMHFNVDIWFGPKPYIGQMLKISAAVAIILSLAQLTCILLNYCDAYKILRYVVIVNMGLIAFVAIPLAIIGFVMGAVLEDVATDTRKINGEMFKVYSNYRDIIRRVNGTTLNRAATDELARAQQKIDWIQQEHLCCGADGVAEWNGSRPYFQSIDVQTLPASLDWWTGCSEPNDGASTVNLFPYNASVDDNITTTSTQKANNCNVPYSCCLITHPGDCYPSVAFPTSCKTTIVRLVARTILCVCALLLGAGVFGANSAIFYYKAASVGIRVQERYHQRLVATGQLGAHQADD